ncbi:hypothetical protein ACOME3_007459 [Neoechinorhynchus agilis]
MKPGRKSLLVTLTELRTSRFRSSSQSQSLRTENIELPLDSTNDHLLPTAMYLPIVPSPNRMKRMLYPDKYNQISSVKAKKRRRIEFNREPYELRPRKRLNSELYEQENKENESPKIKTRRRKISKLLGLNDSSNHIKSSTTEKRPPKSEQMNYKLFGSLYLDREYKCSKCVKCRRTSLEDILYQKGQCGFESCGFEYCILCHAVYHPCRPCYDTVLSKKCSNKLIKRGQLRRC